MKIRAEKIIALSLMMMGFSCVGMAQMESQFSQYMLNRLSFNPAYAGSTGSICAAAMYRTQWLGMQLDPPVPGFDAGSLPTNYLFTFDSPVKFLHGGIGLTLAGEKIGYHSAMSASVDYAFRIYWGPGNLAAAIEGSIFNASTDFTQYVGSDAFSGNYTEPLGETHDPAISSDANATDMLIDASTGVYYQVPGLYYFGFTVKNMLAAKSDVLHYQNARLLYLMGGYEYTIPANPSFRLKPSALVKMANFSTFQIDVSCLLDYQNLFWGGVGYRFQDAVSFLAGFNWNKLRLGLAYDLTTSRLGYGKSGRADGTLEAYMRYCFKVIIPQKPPTSYRNTRYLF